MPNVHRRRHTKQSLRLLTGGCELRVRLFEFVHGRKAVRKVPPARFGDVQLPRGSVDEGHTQRGLKSCHPGTYRRLRHVEQPRRPGEASSFNNLDEHRDRIQIDRLCGWMDSHSQSSHLFKAGCQTYIRLIAVQMRSASHKELK